MSKQKVYRPILRRAFEITIQYKYLWILGFFATLFGSGGELEILRDRFASISEGDILGSESLLTVIGAGGAKVFGSALGALAALGVGELVTLAALFVVILFMVWISVGSQGALIRSAALAEDRGKIHVWDELKGGLRSFWPLLGTLAAPRVLAFFLLAVIGLPLGAIILPASTVSVASVAAFILFVFGVPLFVVASLLAKFAVGYLTIEKKTWQESLVFAWKLFAGHWLVSLEMVVLLFLASIAAVLLFVAALIFMSIPLALLGVILAQTAAIGAVGFLIKLAIILFLALFLIFTGALYTFQYSAWTLLFLQIKDKRHSPKLIRLISATRERYG